MDTTVPTPLAGSGASAAASRQGREPSAEATRAALAAELALQQEDKSGALAALRAACLHDERSPYLRLRLAEVLLSTGDAEAADDAGRAAVDRAAGDIDARVEGLRLRAAARVLLGDGESARRLLREALTARPGDADASAELAALLVTQGAPAEAEQVIDEWQARTPGVVQGRVFLARAFADVGEVDRAFAQLHTALKVRGDDADALRLQRDLCWATGRFDDAAAAARALARVDDGGPDVRTGLLTALALATPDEAQTLARAWLVDDDGEGVRLLVADSFERAGLLDDALSALTPSAPAPRASDVLVLERARLLLARGRPRDARRLACDDAEPSTAHDGTRLPGRKSPATADDDIALVVYRASLCARALADDGDADGAIVRLLSLLAAQNPNERLLEALAVIVPRASASRVAASRQVVSAMASRDGLSPGEAWSVASVLDAVGASDDARMLLQTRLALFPDDPTLTLAWARLREQQASTPAQVLAAVELVERLMERRGADVDALNFVAFATLEADRHGDQDNPGPSTRRADDARSWAWRAVLRVPLSGAVVDTFGWALLARGDIAEAVAVLRRATRLLPGDGEVWFHRAVAERAAVDGAVDGATLEGARAAAARARVLLAPLATLPRHAQTLRRLDRLDRVDGRPPALDEAAR